MPTTHHERTQVSVITKQALAQPKPETMIQQEVAEPIEVPSELSSEDETSEEEPPTILPIAAVQEVPQTTLGNFEVAVPGMSLPTISEDNMHLMSLSGDASARLLDV